MSEGHGECPGQTCQQRRGGGGNEQTQDLLRCGSCNGVNGSEKRRAGHVLTHRLQPGLDITAMVVGVKKKAPGSLEGVHGVMIHDRGDPNPFSSLPKGQPRQPLTAARATKMEMNLSTLKTRGAKHGFPANVSNT